MGILSKIVESLTPASNYSEQQQREFMDGFRLGYPLQGQPDYPVHDSPVYQRGLRYGRNSFNKMGQPQIPYEPPIGGSSFRG